MKIGKRLSFGIRACKTRDFKWFYCPLAKGIGREEFIFFWWFGHKWWVALSKKERKG